VGFLYQAALRQTGDIAFFGESESEWASVAELSSVVPSLYRVFVPQRDGLLPYLPGADAILDRSGGDLGGGRGAGVSAKSF